jgi:hypothetical protein
VRELFKIVLEKVISLYRFVTYRAGLTKCTLAIENDGSAAFSYSEKGVKIDGKPSIIFIHGLSSTKETWLPIIMVSIKESILFHLMNK